MQQTNPPQPGKDSGDRFRFFYDKVSPWVSRGTVYAFEMHEELAEPTIHEYESAICALTVVTTGAVLGVTCGRRGHLFYYHPSYYVVDLGVIGQRPVAGGAIVRTQGDEVVGGWHGESGGLFRHSAAREMGTGQEDFRARKNPVEFLSLPEGETGVLALARAAAGGRTYGITPGNRIICLADDGDAIAIEAECGSPMGSVVIALPDGDMLGAGAEGRLWRYTPGSGEVRFLDAWVPCGKGKRYVAGVASLVCTASGGVFGGTSTDGFLFRFDPERNVVTNLGKPDRQSCIRVLTEGHDGLIYGVVDEPDGMARLFFYDPGSGGFQSLGLLSAFIPVQWTPHCIGAMCTGINGEIFLGESDTLSHLFVYYPPVVRKA